jgi:hypothetical protein
MPPNSIIDAIIAPTRRILYVGSSTTLSLDATKGGKVLKGYHPYKDEEKLAWLDNRDQVKLDLKKLMRRIENEVMLALETRFLEGLDRGELLELRPGQETLKTLIVDQAKALSSS